MSKKAKLAVAGVVAAISFGGFAPALSADHSARNWPVHVGDTGPLFHLDEKPAAGRMRDATNRIMDRAVYRTADRLVDRTLDNLDGTVDRLLGVINPR